MPPRHIAAALAVALASLGAPTLAADSNASAGTAGQIARLLVPPETWAMGVTQLSQSVQQQLQGHPGSSLRYPSDLSQKVNAELTKVLPYEELVAMHARQLSSSYTDAELKDLLTFYRSPTGQKWLREAPKVSQAVAQETQKRFEQKMPEVMSRLGALAQSPGGAAPATPSHDRGTKPGNKTGK